MREVAKTPRQAHPSEKEYDVLMETEKMLETMRSKIIELNVKSDDARQRAARADATIIRLETSESELSDAEVTALRALKASREGYNDLINLAQSSARHLGAHLSVVEADYKKRLTEWKKKIH